MFWQMLVNWLDGTRKQPYVQQLNDSTMIKMVKIVNLNFFKNAASLVVVFSIYLLPEMSKTAVELSTVSHAESCTLYCFYRLNY